MIKWKLLSEESVYEAPLFRIKKKEFKLPNGSTRSYSVVERDPTVIIFPLDEDSNIYLIRQYRYLFDAVILASVAGFIDKGEEPLAAAKRELKEETGIVASDWTSILDLDGAASVIEMKASLFLARDLSFEKPSPTESEQIELVKMPIKDAVKKIMDGKIRNSAAIIGILMIDKLIEMGKI